MFPGATCIVIRASCLLIAVASCAGATRVAHAQAPVPAPRVHVSAEGAEGAVFLEERDPREETRDAKGAPIDTWRFVCALPCQAVVTADPYAEHRIVDGKRARRIVIDGKDGASRVVTYERAAASSPALIVGGIALEGTGVVFFMAGLVKALSGPSHGQCDGDRLCEREREKARADVDAAQDANAKTSLSLVSVGAVMIVVGAVVLIGGAVSSSSSLTVTAPGDGRRVPSRSPTWARPELPRPPNHTKLLELRF